MVSVPWVGARVEELQNTNLHPRLVIVGGLVLHNLHSHGVIGGRGRATGRQQGTAFPHAVVTSWSLVHSSCLRH